MKALRIDHNKVKHDKLIEVLVKKGNHQKAAVKIEDLTSEEVDIQKGVCPRSILSSICTLLRWNT